MLIEGPRMDTNVCVFTDSAAMLVHAISLTIIHQWPQSWSVFYLFVFILLNSSI